MRIAPSVGSTGGPSDVVWLLAGVLNVLAGVASVIQKHGEFISKKYLLRCNDPILVHYLPPFTLKKSSSQSESNQGDASKNASSLLLAARVKQTLG
jgi:hypothetical protein